jgi:uncharacterized protein YcbX
VPQLYVYPIKALRGIPLETARLGPLGIRYDRHFMLLKVEQDGQIKKMQLSSHPQCALFEQRMVSDAAVIVRYHAPPTATGEDPVQQNRAELRVPLEPDIAHLKRVDINLHGSPASAAYRMGGHYDEWFSSCFGFNSMLVYIGDGRRRVLGSALLPPASARHRQQQQQQQGWFSTLTSYVAAPVAGPPPPVLLTFSDVAPFLVTTESSLGNVARRLPADVSGKVGMYKFRPNLVVDGEGEWEEDFWAELTVSGENRLLVTGNCARCTSLNVDYQTGKPAIGELGTVLKKLMKDRRVDPGVKWSPIFGRYAFLAGEEEIEVSVGDEVEVTEHRSERSVFDWPGLA